MDVDFSSLAISILVLLSIVAVFAVLGNGFVLGIVARFKTFRTFPNILIANLALIDFFNALINIPIYLLWAVLNVEWFTGKAVATISLLLSRLFIILNIVSMVVVLVNVFLAIELDLKYYTWKTNQKAVKIVVVEWVVCVIATALLSWFDSDIDLQDASCCQISSFHVKYIPKGLCGDHRSFHFLCDNIRRPGFLLNSKKETAGEITNVSILFFLFQSPGFPM